MERQELTSATDNWGAPERVALVSSVDGEGRPNLIAIGLGKKSHSCANIEATGQFVFAIPGTDLAQEVLYCGTHSGREVDKFAETRLTAASASQVQSPLVSECLSNLECLVVATQEIGEYLMFFGEVVAVWTTDRDERRPLLTIDSGPRYELLETNGIFRLGAVRA